MKLNDKIWELKQPREAAFDQREKNPHLDPGRWLTIEENHAGSDNEESHLRMHVYTSSSLFRVCSTVAD